MDSALGERLALVEAGPVLGGDVDGDESHPLGQCDEC
jgi:hypothetical protein